MPHVVVAGALLLKVVSFLSLLRRIYFVVSTTEVFSPFSSPLALSFW